MDFKSQTVQGKGYDGETGTGRELWAEVEQRLRLQPMTKLQEETATLAAIESHGFGKPQIVLPRLGQGTGLLQNNRFVFDLLVGNTSVSENRKTGEKSPTVYFIDFKTAKNNSFIAVCQFKLRVLGTEHHIIPDVVLFLNGLPVVVIECKSPKVKEPIPEAIDQLLRYSEQREGKGEGCAELFYYNQFLITTCRQEAKFGTISTHNEKHFYRWSDPYPRNLNDLAHGSSSPNDQQRLVAGMLDHDNLLDIIRTFTLFPANDKGELIKVVGRYQQFRAVKLAVKRLLEGKSPRERSGIIWHTQGSGKSLTMMFMVREMYRQLTRMKCDVVISSKHNDDLHLLPYTNRSTHEATIKSFKLPFGSEDEGVRGDMGIVIVNNMLLTGFDAPVEQVMYLDKIIVQHGLLQAIARVNRVDSGVSAASCSNVSPRPYVRGCSAELRTLVANDMRAELTVRAKYISILTEPLGQIEHNGAGNDMKLLREGNQ